MIGLLAVSLMLLTACATAFAGSGHGRGHSPQQHHPKPKHHHKQKHHHKPNHHHKQKPQKPAKLPYDVTTKLEAKRVDRVPAPEPNWEPCYEEWGSYECATFPVPLDYDKPTGPQVQLALLKHPASKPEQRIGSLFVNPGGPGAGAQGLALEMPFWFGAEVIDRFDVIGMDPRGVGGSQAIRCFDTFEERNAAWEGHLNPVNLPATPAEEEAEVRSARAVAAGCSSFGQPLASHMSTAEVARDIDVLRRAVGDEKLTFWGVSYGSYLGQVYANMFPDRVRAINIDGNIEPRAWVGNLLTRYQPMFDRERSADGTYKALVEILRRCAAVGQPTCKFAGGNPLAKFGQLAKRLRTETVKVKVGGFGEVPARTLNMGYNWFVQQTRTMLAYPTGWESIDAMLAALWTLTGEAAGNPSPAAISAARRSLNRALTTRPGAVAALTPREEAQEATMSFEESLRAVMCSDGLHAPDASLWRLTGALADKRAPYFGRVWNYIDTPCATNVWTALDEDAYFGPFNRRTANPVLITSNYWDPNTNYDNGVAIWKLLPGSRLISADSWGHAAYWTAPCVEDTVDQYFITAVAPPPLTKCKGVVQPFETMASSSKRAGSGYVPRLPGNALPNPALVARRN